jgi:hypothetical protein
VTVRIEKLPPERERTLLAAYSGAVEEVQRHDDDEDPERAPARRGDGTGIGGEQGPLALGPSPQGGGEEHPP